MDNTKHNKKGLRTVGFCAGYGGLERGLESAGVGIQPVAFSEIEAYPIANLLAKMEKGTIHSAPIWSNLKTFPMAEFYGKVDLLTGGFPCQPFSAAGARKGDEDPRHLFPYFKNFLSVIKPRYCFLENVDGISTAKLKGNHWADPEGTPVLLHVCRELERLGYRVASGCFNAEEMGAPHKRNRWFIYGELANSKHNGYTTPEEPGSIRQSEVERRLLESTGVCAPHGDLSLHATGQWPAGPGPEQHNYEEPRTVANRNSILCGGWEKHPNRKNCKGFQGDKKGDRCCFWGETEGRCRNGEAEEPATKPELGRATNGATGRVDPVTHRVERIRMCGNGVVPQTAGRAWTVLQWQVRNGKEGHAPIYKDPETGKLK